MEELSFKSLKKRYILVILIIPIVSIFILSLIVKYGTMIINTKELIIDVSSPIKIGEYLNYYFSIIGIELTALLSYFIWRTSVKSTNLAQAINDKEENRDKEKVRESALIVYYDLISKISILKSLYSKNFLKDDQQEIRKISLTSDWVKNIANLRNILTASELETIFNLYNSFLLIYELERSGNDKSDELKVVVEKLANKIFIPVLLKYLWMDVSGETEAMLNSEYYLILRKIESTSNNDLEFKYYLTNENGKKEVSQNNGSVKYIGVITNGILKNGTDQWTSNNGQVIYLFKYENYKIVEGRYTNKIKKEYELIFNCKFDNEGKESSGKTTFFYDSKRIRYQGDISDGIYNGKGKLYTDNKLSDVKFTGVWKDGSMLNGEFINKSSYGIKYFKGEYKYNLPYSGEIEVSHNHEFKGAYGFKGTIIEGKLIKGYGHKFSKNYFDKELLKRHPEYEQRDNQYEDNEYEGDYEPEEIPEEVEIEMRENSIRYENENSRESLLRDCGQVVELIEAKWVDGECEVFPDDLLYKTYFGINIKD